jgi:hypothetical protein
MAKARLIASEIFDDDWFGPLPFFEQVLWAGLFAKCADDQGRFLDNPITIRAAIFPYKDIALADVRSAILKFAEADRIYRYSAGGKIIIQIVHWWDHQPQQWASRSKWPAPPLWEDHIRTRQNNQYFEENWHNKSNGDSHHDWLIKIKALHESSGERSGEPQDDVQVNVQLEYVGHVPIPIPIPVPVSVRTMLSDLPSEAELSGEPPPERATPAAATPPPPPKAKQKAKPPKVTPEKPPAVLAYFETAGKFPHKSLWADIDRDVGREEINIVFWKRVVKGYIGKGWNPGNVANMIEFYQRREIPGANGRRNGQREEHLEGNELSGAECERLVKQRTDEYDREIHQPL